ncbi:hypothetical protein T484DRAFT_2018897, partial [Baffinella frigidus]
MRKRGRPASKPVEPEPEPEPEPESEESESEDEEEEPVERLTRLQASTLVLEAVAADEDPLKMDIELPLPLVFEHAPENSYTECPPTWPDPPRPTSIPRPEIRAVPRALGGVGGHGDVTGFVRGEKYLSFSHRGEDEEDDFLDYDLEADDEAFLVSAKGPKGERLPPDVLEDAIHILEVASYRALMEQVEVPQRPNFLLSEDAAPSPAAMALLGHAALDTAPAAGAGPPPTFTPRTPAGNILGHTPRTPAMTTTPGAAHSANQIKSNAKKTPAASPVSGFASPHVEEHIEEHTTLDVPPFSGRDEGIFSAAQDDTALAHTVSPKSGPASPFPPALRPAPPLLPPVSSERPPAAGAAAGGAASTAGAAGAARVAAGAGAGAEGASLPKAAPPPALLAAGAPRPPLLALPVERPLELPVELPQGDKKKAGDRKEAGAGSFLSPQKLSEHPAAAFLAGWCGGGELRVSDLSAQAPPPVAAVAAVGAIGATGPEAPPPREPHGEAPGEGRIFPVR